MTDDILSPTIVYPFPKIINSPTDIVGRITKREAFLECPTCLGIDNFYNCKEDVHYKAGFCKGNQPAELEHFDHTGQKCSHPITCAGILEPHFHVQCACCEKIFLLALPGANSWAR
jgi:hypothetical protein